ncbi:FecR domain-containing protein [Pseudomonas cichorii]|uniref:FecR domain-containing protein n=1 Tax=Pseudomonas cichorii TaxID=36746 RepID=UPI001C893283|nr:FecR domain-containing protein [Pseudomonas cichorii]MBX8484029.1 FecR domain-containing protein [Pseudomonas cichorii]
MSAQAPISRDVARQAAHWLVLMHEQPLNPAQQQACARWRATDPEHERAWQRVQHVQQQLGGLPPAIAMGALNRERRQALKTLLVLAAMSPAVYLGYRFGNEQGWMADYRTRTGERQQLTLADGSVVDLNTDSAIDVRFDAGQRLIRLVRGEILISTGVDARPLRVASEQGLMEPLGTRFSVRQLSGTTQLAVLQGRVRATPAHTASHVVESGEQVSFSVDAFGPLRPASELATRWTQGELVAENLPLSDFLQELSRYRPGRLHCDDSASALRISGGFQLDNSDAILAALPTTLPVTVSYRTRYWVTVSKA